MGLCRQIDPLFCFHYRWLKGSNQLSLNLRSLKTIHKKWKLIVSFWNVWSKRQFLERNGVTKLSEHVRIFNRAGFPTGLWSQDTVDSFRFWICVISPWSWTSCSQAVELGRCDAQLLPGRYGGGLRGRVDSPARQSDLSRCEQNHHDTQTRRSEGNVHSHFVRKFCIKEKRYLLYFWWNFMNPPL